MNYQESLGIFLCDRRTVERHDHHSICSRLRALVPVSQPSVTGTRACRAATSAGRLAATTPSPPRASFRRSAPVERVWLAVLLYIGLRRGDAVCLGRQHIRHGVATLRTEKTGVTVTIPILPVLDEVLKAGPCADLAFICGENGGPLPKESFGNVFRDACNAAGVTKSAHGVRKIGATRAANNGATVAELEAIFGWNGGRMASLYTRAADRARLAKGAMAKLDRTPGEQTIPAPAEKVREPERKDQ